MKYIKTAWGLFFEKKNFIYFLKVSLPVLILTFIQIFIFPDGRSSFINGNDVNYLILIPFVLIGIVFGVWFQAVSVESVIRVVDGGKFEFKDTYKKAWGYTARLFAVSLVAGLIIFGGFILLVIPGIIFAVWYAFPQFAVATKYSGVREALKESKSLSQRRFWKVLWQLVIIALFSVLIQIAFSIIPNGIGGVILTIFGGLFLLPYYLLYQDLAKEEGLEGKI